MCPCNTSAGRPPASCALGTQHAASFRLMAVCSWRYSYPTTPFGIWHVVSTLVTIFDSCITQMQYASKNSLDRMDNLGKLIIELYRTAQEMPVDEFQEFSMVLFKSLLPFDSARCTAGEMTPQGFRPWEAFLHNKSIEVISDYAAIKHVDPVAKASFANPGSIVRFHSPTLYRAKKDLALRDYTRSHENINGMTAIYTARGSNEMQSISIFRANEDSYFSEQECRMAALVFPHLLEATKVNRTLALCHIHQRADQVMAAIAYLNGELRYCGTGFRKLLNSEWPDWEGPLLPATLLHELGRFGTDGYYSNRGRITAKRIGELLFLRADEVAAPVSRVTVHPEVLQCAYDLTPAETRVAFALLDGSSAKAAAKALNVSPNTVRTQIREVYAKLGVNTRAHFVKRMLELAPR